MLGNYLLKGVLIGIVFGVPAGAIGALTIQHALSHGFRAGFVTGLGSSAADLLYACVGVFGLTAVSDLLLRYQTIISLIGGVLIAALGVLIFRKENKPPVSDVSTAPLPVYFCTAFATAITNPATVLTFFVAFAAFGIGKHTPTQSVQLILGILMGTCFWWGLLSALTAKLRERITDNVYRILNHILGSLMILFSMVMMARTFIE